MSDEQTPWWLRPVEQGHPEQQPGFDRGGPSTQQIPSVSGAPEGAPTMMQDQSLANSLFEPPPPGYAPGPGEPVQPGQPLQPAQPYVQPYAAQPHDMAWETAPGVVQPQPGVFPGQPPQPPGPGPSLGGRGPLIIAAAVGTVAVIVAVVLLLTGGDDDKGGSGRSAGTAPPASTGPQLPGTEAEGLTQVEPPEALAGLEKAGEDPGGDVASAWRWTDSNGQNLLVMTTEPGKSDDSTLRVIHVAGLDGDPNTLRVMRDPGLPGCRGEGEAGFTDGSVQVRDLDGNGIAEAMVGWSSHCGGADSPSKIRLALITGGDKYILRGEGVIGGQGEEPKPDPAGSRWPGGYLDALTTLYHSLYY